MRRTLLALACAPVATQLLQPGTLCFPATNNLNCLSWSLDATNISFTATFSADPENGIPVWGAWGLPVLTCGNMWPANVWLVLPSPAGTVRVEDRVTVTHAAPQCAKGVPQLSHTIAGSVAPDGTVNVTWTRLLAPPPSFRQPAITRGMTALIGAYALGETFDFPACGTAGLPFHSNVVNGVSVDFFGATHAVSAAVSAGVPEAPYAGLAGILSVCGDSCAALTRISSSTGRVSFPSADTPLLFPLLTALDGVARVVHTLAFDNSPPRSPSIFVASLSADTGALLGSCATRFELNDGYAYANLNFAFDSASGEVLIAACTDDACIAPLNVTALRPGSCATRELAALSAEDLEVGGSGAVDPYARVFVFSLARGGSKPGLAVVALNITSGAVVRVASETQSSSYVQSLVFDDSSRLIYGLAFTTALYSQPVLVAINARSAKLRVIGAVIGCAGALPDSLAVSPDGSHLFFVGSGAGGAATLFTIFSANATVFASVPLQGFTSDSEAPPSLFWLP